MLCAYRRFTVRSVDNVCSEIGFIVRKIYEINDSLNVREIIAELMEQNKDNFATCADRISELFKNASELSLELSELFGILESLRLELGELLHAEGIRVLGGCI